MFYYSVLLDHVDSYIRWPFQRITEWVFGTFGKNQYWLAKICVYFLIPASVVEAAGYFVSPDKTVFKTVCVVGGLLVLLALGWKARQTLIRWDTQWWEEGFDQTWILKDIFFALQRLFFAAWCLVGIPLYYIFYGMSLTEIGFSGVWYVLFLDSYLLSCNPLATKVGAKAGHHI